MPATLIDERRPPACSSIKLAAVRLAAFGELVGAISHALLPFTGPERARVCLQPFGDLGRASGPAQVGAEPGQPVIDDVGVGVVEAGQHGRAGQVDHACPGSAKAHHLRSATGEDEAARNREVTMGLKARAPERSDSTASEDEVGLQATLD